MKIISAFVGILWCVLCPWRTLLAAPSDLQVVGYFPGWSVAEKDPFVINSDTIQATKLTVINYAFLDICWDGKHGNPAVTNKNDVHDCLDGAGKPVVPPNGSIVLGNPEWDVDLNGAGKNNLGRLLALKKNHPTLKLVASVGGWDWSNRFSQTASTAQTRQHFADSAVEFLRQYEFDGIDIDWEYPGAIGIPCAAGQQCDQPDDKANFVLLVDCLRHSLDQAGTQDGKHYLITIAAGASPKYIHDQQSSGAWLSDLVVHLDWVNLMNYDYHGPWELQSGLHSPLYRTTRDVSPVANVANSDVIVTMLLNYIPAKKLVLGLAFYGYGWSGCQPGPKADGLYQSCQGGMDNVSGTGESNINFSTLVDLGYLRKGANGAYGVGGLGYTRFWDSNGQVPYLYNAAKKLFISYEDEQSIHAKDKYILRHGLLGGMFWELNADRHHTLGNVVAQDLLGK